MVNQLPKQQNIWLEASSNEITNIENIWKKCGFSFYKSISDNQCNDHRLYKRMNL